MIRLTEFSLRQKSVVILLAIGIFIGGLFSWTTLKQELIPDISLPFVMVIAPMPGAGAEDVATQVTEPIERALINVPDLETTQSSAANSMSMTFAEFDFGTDVKVAVDDVERAIGTAGLPEDVEPLVMSFSGKGLLAGLIVIFIVLLAYGQFLRLFLDIEENTRRTAASIAKR